ncbi:hypothetical protein PMA3_07825 [Pseudomonas silesiensis]|uniref:Uncharacterized protein n=1 Tax=Pseudomonas silesiensis TaxID=1853130 RepID=A0A191YQL8_9PSED|nr:hypothetical protein [Pseudomonas silesiensis]ANJ55073.1 hypothetical protein PMA3_07825 [Pseudomonas silesiensis]
MLTTSLFGLFARVKALNQYFFRVKSMAKPPKIVPGSNSTGLPSTPARPATADNSTLADLFNIGIPGTHVQGADMATGTHLSAVSPGAGTHQPSVLVSDIPGTGPSSVGAYLRSITWPADQTHLLRPIGNDTGLFASSDGKTYANLGEEGHVLVVPRYQVPLPDASGVPGPFLTKVEGQTLWRIELPYWLSVGLGANTQAQAGAVAGRPSPPTFVPPHLASLLTKAESSEDGIRYDKHKRSYVDMQEGTVLVRKNGDGHYQVSSLSELIPSGALLERIPGTKLWRPVIKTVAEPGEAAPGPSKRPHPDEESSRSADTDIIADDLLSNESIALDLSYGQWRNWGKSTQPQSGQSIEIDGLHYPIVPQVMQPETRLVYLEHPGFSPARYDAFERMLLDNPSLQPKWVIKKDDQWKVVEKRLPFEMSLSQYVGSTFRYLSDHSASTVARAVFDQSSQFAAIDAHGLALMGRTFHHWVDRTSVDAPRRELADPLMMLPVLPTTLSGTDAIISLPTPSAALQRLDFDPARIPQAWGDYLANAPGTSLRSLFSTVLEDNGYSVNRTTRLLSEDALLFHREGLDAVFVLRFPATSLLGNMKRPVVPGSELSDPAYRARIGETQWQELARHLDLDKVIYLLGGTQPRGPDQTTLFIVRES